MTTLIYAAPAVKGLMTKVALTSLYDELIPEQIRGPPEQVVDAGAVSTAAHVVSKDAEAAAVMTTPI